MDDPRPLAEEIVAGLWCVAYAAPEGVDVIVYPVRQGRPDVSGARCVFAGRRSAGRWLAVAKGKPSRALATWADLAGNLPAPGAAGR